MANASKIQQSEMKPLRKSLEVDNVSASDNKGSRNSTGTDRDRDAGTDRGASPHYAPMERLHSNLKSVIYIMGSLYFLHSTEVYHKVMHSPHIRHSWLSLGLAASVAILGLKSYTELYQGKIKKTRISYETHPQTTHIILFLFVFTSVCLHVAIWPVYGFKSFLVSFALGFGLVLQIMLVLPVILQNFLGAVTLMTLLQQYNSY